MVVHLSIETVHIILFFPVFAHEVSKQGFGSEWTLIDLTEALYAGSHTYSHQVVWYHYNKVMNHLHV